MVKRRPRVPRLFWPHYEVNSIDCREDYYRRLCFLFKPWRIENKLMDCFNNYEEVWINYMHNLSVDNNFSNCFNANQDAIADINRLIQNQNNQLQMEKDLYEHRRQMKLIMKAEEIENDATDDIEIFDRCVNKEQHIGDLKNMNNGQRDIFDLIVSSIEKQQVVSSLIFNF